MSDYFTLKPMGYGTSEIESFHSYFYRYAALHSTTMIPMAKHLSLWWEKRIAKPFELKNVHLYEGRGMPLCGYSDATASYVEVVSTAARFPNLYRTTLLPLREAADSVCHQVLKAGRAWCPACMYWSKRNSEIYYDKLLWSLLAIQRCAEHRIVLVGSCPKCGIKQRYYNSLNITFCWKCGESLVQSPDDWLFDEKPCFGEKDCLAMVEAIAEGRLIKAVPKAYKLFSDEMTVICGPLRGFPDSTKGKGPRSWKSRASPTFATLLKRCHLTGTALVDVLTDPIGAAHASGELELSKYEIPVTLKPCQTKAAATRVKRRLIRELSRPEEDVLLSFAELSRVLGVSVGFIRYREPSLCKEYARRVQFQNCRLHLQKTHAVSDALKSGAVAAYLKGEYASQDELVDYLCNVHNAKKHIVRRQVAWALKRRSAAAWLRDADSGLTVHRFMPKSRNGVG